MGPHLVKVALNERHGIGLSDQSSLVVTGRMQVASYFVFELLETPAGWR